MLVAFSQLSWGAFPYFGIATILLCAIGALFAWRGKRSVAMLLSILGVVSLGLFIAGLWISQARPPMRTQGETRLFYSLFVLLSGLLVYLRWGYRWIFSFSTILSGVFIIINIVKPQIHSKAMMPALQSPYFVPHVISYMFAYGLLGVALLICIYIVWQRQYDNAHKIYVMDNLVYTGLGFLMIGLLLGAIWAKEAWGTYWGWDPKETWAAITMCAYLLFVHYRRFSPHDLRGALWVLIGSFLFLQMCWYGVNYLPSASNSVHVYGL